MANTTKGYLAAVLSGVIYGFTPILSKALYAAGMNVTSLLLQRNLISLLIMFGLVRFHLKQPILLDCKSIKRLLIISLFAGILTPILIQTSYLYIPSGTATTLHFIYPIVTVIMGGVIFKEKTGKVKWMCVLCCSVGILLFYTPGGEANLFGVILALGSGVTFGAYMVLLNHIGLENVHSFQISLYNSFFGLLVFGGYALATDQFYIPLAPYTLGIGILSAVLSGVLAFSFLQFGIRTIGAQRAAILSTLEPITSIIMGILIFQDSINGKTMIGMVLILMSVLMITLFDKETLQHQEEGYES